MPLPFFSLSFLGGLFGGGKFRLLLILGAAVVVAVLVGLWRYEAMRADAALAEVNNLRFALQTAEETLRQKEELIAIQNRQIEEAQARIQRTRETTRRQIIELQRLEDKPASALLREVIRMLREAERSAQ